MPSSVRATRPLAGVFGLGDIIVANESFQLTASPLCVLMRGTASSPKETLIWETKLPELTVKWTMANRRWFPKQWKRWSKLNLKAARTILETSEELGAVLLNIKKNGSGLEWSR